MAISQELLLVLRAQNNTAAAFAGMNRSINELKDNVLKVAAAIGGALALRDVIQTTENWADSVRKVKEVTGATTEAASRMMFAARAFGIDADELSTGLGRLARNMFSNTVEADKGKDAFFKWGIAIKDAQGNTRNLNDVLADAAERVRELGEGAASRALEIDLFGRAGGRLHQLLMQGAEGVHELARESDALGLTLGGASFANIQAFARASRVFGLALDGLKVTLGTALLPLLSSLVVGLTRMIAAVVSALTHNQMLAGVLKALGEAARRVAGFFKELGEALGRASASAALEALRRFMADIGGAMDRAGLAGSLLKDVLLAIGGALVLGGLANLLLKILAIGTAILSAPLVAAGLFLVALWEVVETIGLITDNWEKFVTAWRTGLLDNIPLFGALFHLARNIGDAFEAAAGVIRGAWDGLTTYLRDRINEFILNLDTIIGKVNQILGTRFPGLEFIGPGGTEPGRRPINPFRPGPELAPAPEIALQAGGLVTRPTYARLGERGPEAVIPLSRGGPSLVTVNVYCSGNITESEGELASRIGDVLLARLASFRSLGF